MSIEVHYQHFFPPKVSRVCSLFQAAAFDTWERIWFSRRTPGLKIHETTITQNLVYEMNLLRDSLAIPNLFIYESRNEATNGNDLDLIVRQRGGRRYRYMIQSKILYHSIRQRGAITHADGTYRQFPHLTNGRPQIEVLIETAESEKVRAIPLYLLYNYVTPAPRSRTYCGVQAIGSQFGCSVIGAHLLRSQFSTVTGNLRRGVRFSHLHQGLAMPWMVLACCLPRYTRKRTLELFKMDPNYALRDYTENLDYDDDEWVLLPPYPTSQQRSDSYRQVVEGFSPRYRMVIDTH